ncbi:Acetyltransferase (GNAT) domain-containing protein [Anaerocolumna jejuensis DSM 15929]|uniref:Acetyltransferase (GNAT) domain-containing protein n=1 Tax=Anaerocolumna jejuensis DSM 15929 TaxID=1121322 RepID=A0A1M6JZV7_9FIRM|nr:GNAT family N-acetyltransferase [Anaerocolumna jejuensis]SHJ52235.1 Acetyltransferase (GNAT) domain-containing protein [Anaerocolumna jejuensis DSM 15929]
MNIELKHSLTVEEYNALRLSVDWKEIPEEQAKRGLSNTYYLTAAVLNGETIGLARVISDGGYVAYIADVIVNQEYQGKGVGRMILNDVMDYIKNVLSGGETVMVILVAAKGKEEFYEKFGFIKRPNEQYGAGMTLWL